MGVFAFNTGIWSFDAEDVPELQSGVDRLARALEQAD